MNLLLTPPLAFLAYIPLVLVLVGIGRLLAGPANANAVKTSVYGSGEASPTFEAAPGYQPFFLIALFFAVVHLAMLVLAVGQAARRRRPSTSADSSWRSWRSFSDRSVVWGTSRCSRRSSTR